MQDNCCKLEHSYVYMRLIFVNIQDNHVNIQDNQVNIQDNQVNMRLDLSYMFSWYSRMLKWLSCMFHVVIVYGAEVCMCFHTKDYFNFVSNINLLNLVQAWVLEKHKDWQKYFNSVIGSCELNHARRHDDSNNHKACIITSINNSL